MGKKQTGFKTKGMNRDLSVSAFNPEFSFENMNLRLSTNDGNTLMSWVTERGTEEIAVKDINKGSIVRPRLLTIEGIPIGIAIMNHQLVLFTTAAGTEKPDYIYLLFSFKTARNGLEANGKVLYNGNLNFNVRHPLETQVSYESENIQKVYWTDGLNQPRVINIATDSSKIKKWNSTTDGSIDSFFDFVPSIRTSYVEGETIKNLKVTVSQETASNGTFAPGTIQYCFTYVNRNAQQSNVVWTSSLHYLTFNDRVPSPDGSIGNSFTIKIENPDLNYDFIRLYSIQRTSINAVPLVKLLADIPIEGNLKSQQFTIEPEYSENPNLTLPKDNNGYIRTVTVSKGIYDVTVVPFENLKDINDNTCTFEVSNSTPMTIVGYTQRTASPQIIDNVISLRDLVNELYTRGPQDLVLKDYHAYIDVSQDVDLLLKSKCREEAGYEVEGWGIKVGDTIYVGDTTVSSGTSIVGFYECHIVYNYKDGKWYITKSDVTETDDREIVGDYIEFIDIGTTGATIDPEELLYVGGKEITALTMIDKEHTLFLGNLSEKNTLMLDIQRYYNDSSTKPDITFKTDGENESVKTLNIKTASGLYSHTHELVKNTDADITTFKGGETYRMGFQLQKATGEWLEPIFLKDVCNDCYPKSFIYNEEVKLPYAECNLNLLALKSYIEERGGVFDSSVYRRIRPVIVYPKIGDRSVLCQGVLNPTVFNAADRYNGIPFAQASWFFRPYVMRTDDPKGHILDYTHYDSLYTQGEAEYEQTDVDTIVENARKVEIQGSRKIWDNVFDANTPVINANTQYFIDHSIVTLNSPDIDFDTEVQTHSLDDYKLRIVGAIPFTAYTSSYRIRTDNSLLVADTGSLESVLNITFDDCKLFYGLLNKNLQWANRKNYLGNRLIAETLWENTISISEAAIPGGTPTEAAVTMTIDWLVHPWQAKQPDEIANYLFSLSAKTEAALTYSDMTEYFSNVGIGSEEFKNISSALHLTENAYVYNIRLPKQRADYTTGGTTITTSEINYYPNIDEELYDKLGYSQLASYTVTGRQGATINKAEADKLITKAYSPITMRYKSASHAVIALKENAAHEIPLLPYATDGVDEYGHYTGNANNTFWGDNYMQFNQKGVAIDNLFIDSKRESKPSFLWLGELYRDDINDETRFGGDAANLLGNNMWVPAGEAVDIEEPVTNEQVTTWEVPLRWVKGDTYYQRYDCLKTYSFSPDDPNQIVEVLSFMCETHVNLDGRYDKNRGQSDNTYITPQNFNLLNPVYSQRDNFFNYRKTDRDKDTTVSYPNLIYFTKTKESGADVDAWTNVTLASTLELDGDKGEIKKLARLNDSLIAFQDTGISQILYNENVAIASTEGVPIELANSGKVQGKRYISNTIGCSNKWSMVTTPSGVYFMDSHNKNIYLFNGQLNNLSGSLGFNSWCKENIPSPSVLWNPSSFGNFVTYYDRINQDVLFINAGTALAYSEKFGTFTSFYDYGGAPYFANLGDLGLWISKSRAEGAGSDYKVWMHNAGDYCRFFDVNKPYWMTLIGNPEPLTDKIFTNLEFRATLSEEVETEEHEILTPNLPFDYLEAWNEYQHGKADLSYKNGVQKGQHFLSDRSASLNRKFRIWRCDIPRDNWYLPPVDTYDASERIAAIEAERKMGISRFKARPLDRMRNMWVYLKLRKNASETTLPKAEIHDVVMTYFD